MKNDEYGPSGPIVDVSYLDTGRINQYCTCSNPYECDSCKAEMERRLQKGKENMEGSETEKVSCCKSDKHVTEQTFPNQTVEFRKIIEEMYQTHLSKNSDYSPANILYMGEVGVIVRIWDKFCRICNLTGIPVPSVKAEIDRKIREYSQELGRTTGSKDNLILLAIEIF